jgi:hypothetical protein
MATWTCSSVRDAPNRYIRHEVQLRRAIENGHSIADGITDTSLGSLTVYARNKLASWQATGHPLVGPTYVEVQSLPG